MFELLNKNDRELLEECEVETFRSSGPGGSKADTSESAVRLTHPPSGVQVTCEETRSQKRNRQIGLKRLRRRYALTVRHEVVPDRIAAPPALREYLEADLKINPSNRWYPFLVKYVLDLFEAYEGRVSDTSDKLEVSTGQLIRFLNGDGDLWEQANKIREHHGHHRLTT